MSVIALSQRAGRHTSQPAGPGRAAPVPRRPPGPAQPALTVTFAIPLGGETLTPQAHRLLEVVRELVESGEGTVTVDPSVPDGVRAGSAADLPAADPADGGAVAVEVALAPPATPHLHELRLLAASRQVLLGGEPLPLTRLEFDLLLFLAQHPRRVFSRVQLLAGVWGYEHTGVRTVDVHVRRLRVKVGETVPLVTTVYGVGYRLADEARVVVVADE